MARGVSPAPVEDVIRLLNEQASELWGKRRAEELRQQLEDTARILAELRQNLPDRDIEPGFYP